MRWEKEDRSWGNFQRWVLLGSFLFHFFSWPVGLRRFWAKCLEFCIIFSFRFAVNEEETGSQEHFNNSIHQGEFQKVHLSGSGKYGEFSFVFVLRNYGCWQKPQQNIWTRFACPEQGYKSWPSLLRLTSCWPGAGDRTMAGTWLRGPSMLGSSVRRLTSHLVLLCACFVFLVVGVGMWMWTVSILSGKW